MALKLDRHFVVVLLVIAGRMGAFPIGAVEKGCVLDEDAVLLALMFSDNL